MIDDDVRCEKFFDIPNNDNTTIFHPNFMENMFQGCKRPLAKKKLKSDNNPPPPLDPILVNNAFWKVLSMKETPQEFLKRVAKESIDMNAEVDETRNPTMAKKVPRKHAKKVLVLGDQTQQLGNISNIQKGPSKHSWKTSGEK